MRHPPLRFWSAAIALLGLAAGLPLARAEDAESTEQRLRRIEERLQNIEQKLDRLEGSPQNGSVQEHTGNSVAAKLDELDQRIRAVDRNRELQREAALKARETPIPQSGTDGFSFKSPGGDFQLKMGGYLQSDGRFYGGGPTGQTVDTFVLRRVRPLLQGTVFQYIDFRILPDFGEGKTVLQDAYLELKYFPAAGIRAGKFKSPFGLERLQSATDLLFVERGLPTSLVPNRDLGIQLSGAVAKGRLSYAVGILNGTPDGASVDLDGNNGKDLVARVFATPFQTASIDHPLKGLGIGIAASTGEQEGTLPAFRTAGQSVYFSYATGASAAGTRTRFSPQAYYYYGPFGLLAEYVRSEQKVGKASASANVSNAAWQVQASYLLTGEHKGYRGVSPSSVFDPARGGWGAWEIAARYGELSIDPGVYSLGFADPIRSARQARAWAAGINWYLNRNVKLVLNYEDTGFDGGAIGGDRSRERAVLTRFQIGF